MRLILTLFYFFFSTPSLSDACFKEYPASDTHVIDVSDRGTFLLSDNRQVKLSNILLPYPPSGVAKGKEWPAYRRAIDAIRNKSSGKNIRFIQTEKWMNRYGVWSGHIRITSSDKSFWLQKYLIQNGLVRLMLTDKAFECFADLLALEDKARVEKKGIWGNNTYRILPAKDIWPLIRARGTFQIIEGQVTEVAEVRGRYYLNFGKNWRNDFTVKISRSSMRSFRKKQIDPKSYKGKLVRVRGWITNRNGPLIEITHPVLIESVKLKAD